MLSGDSGGKLGTTASAAARTKADEVSRIHHSPSSVLRATRAVALVVAVVCPAPLRAAESASPTLEAGASPLAEARYRVGRTLYAQGDYSGAAREFEMALAIFPQSAKLAFNLARTCERLEDDERALAAYRSYLQVAPEAPDRAEIDRIIASLEQRVEAARPRLVVTSEPSGAEVRVDGLTERFVTPATIAPGPGTHIVRLQLAGQPEVSRSVTVERGQSVPLHVTLIVPEPLRPEPPPVAASAVAPPSAAPEPPGAHLAGWVVGGVGLALMGVGTYSPKTPRGSGERPTSSSGMAA